MIQVLRRRARSRSSRSATRRVASRMLTTRPARRPARRAGSPAAARNSSDRVGVSTPKSRTGMWARTASSTAPGSAPTARRRRLPERSTSSTSAPWAATHAGSTVTSTRR